MSNCGCNFPFVRDDIHKSAPVPTRWKRVIQACERDADWQSEGLRLAHAALASELNAQIGTKFLNRVRDALDPEQRSLLADHHAILSLVDGKHTPVEESIAEHVDRLAVEGHSQTLILRAAVICVAEERVDRWRRACAGHVLKVGGIEAQEQAVRIEKSADSVPLAKIANEIAEHGKADTSSLKKPALDLDEDLLGGR